MAERTYDPTQCYCGPGKCLLPLWFVGNELNALCFIHDGMYQDLTNEGHDPYWKYNLADETLLQNIRQMRRRNLAAYIVVTVFSLKKWLL